MADFEGARDAVPGEAGAVLGSSDPTVLVEKSDRGALIKLTNLGATSQFRNKHGRAGRKSSRQLLGTDVQVDGYKARALLDPGAGKRNLTAHPLGVCLGDPSLRHRIGLFWLIPGIATTGYFIIYLVLLQW